jgi:dihydrofolate synthase/folylpolyglutamate synthase
MNNSTTMHPSIETYEQAIEFLFGRINYERLHHDLYSTSDFKLDRMAHLLERIENPQLHIPVVHIAGSKGKGSTAAMIAAGLRTSGRKTGLFTSPHIDAFEERMVVDGVQPTREELTQLVDDISDVVRQIESEPGHVSPTYFELATALAWQHFRNNRVEWAVLEVGLGGRLDATNLCQPFVSVITSISRDHTRLLGSKLDRIAREKAGIIKPGVPVVCGVEQPDALAAIEDAAALCNSQLWRLGREIQLEYNPQRHTARVETPARTWPEIHVPLFGRHQAANTALAAAAIDLACHADQGSPSIPVEPARHAIEQIEWPVRIETVRLHPTVIVDAAHNWASYQALIETLDTLKPNTSLDKPMLHPANLGNLGETPNYRHRLLIFATSRDKDIDGALRQLLPHFDTVILTQFQNNPRAVPVESLHRRVRELFDTPVHATADPAAAWHLGRKLAGPDDLVCVTGSFFIAAEIRELVRDQPLTRHEPTHPGTTA